MKTEILCGLHSVREALAAGRREIVEVFVQRDHEAAARVQQVAAAARAAGVPVREVGAQQLSTLCGGAAHQGAAARASVYVCDEIEDILDADGSAASGPLLALDQIVDPHNLGAVLRTALCAGVHAVLMPKDRAAPPTPAVSRISAGALEHIRLVQVVNLVRGLESLKSAGRWVVGLDGAAERSIYGTDLSIPLVLVLGGEGKGMRPLVRRTCDLLVAIPQSGPLDSLNASVAAGVALFEIARQRSATLGASGGPVSER
jgi:23S rRNA (guanosine2251-2'-O)-methyltransferase